MSGWRDEDEREGASMDPEALVRMSDRLIATCALPHEQLQAALDQDLASPHSPMSGVVQELGCWLGCQQNGCEARAFWRFRWGYVWSVACMVCMPLICRTAHDQGVDLYVQRVEP